MFTLLDFGDTYLERMDTLQYRFDCTRYGIESLNLKRMGFDEYLPCHHTELKAQCERLRQLAGFIKENNATYEPPEPLSLGPPAVRVVVDWHVSDFARPRLCD